MVVKPRKWEVVRINTGSGKPWRALCPFSYRADIGCQCKSYPTWREAMAHALGAADAALVARITARVRQTEDYIRIIEATR
jgi:hypothetical protein